MNSEIHFSYSSKEKSSIFHLLWVARRMGIKNKSYLSRQAVCIWKDTAEIRFRNSYGNVRWNFYDKIILTQN